MRGRVLGTIAAGLLGLLPLGCGGDVFTCHSDAQCVGEGMGLCQPDGYCSFPAADCPSGQRYGEHSGPRAGQCVAEGGDAGSTGEPTTTTTTGPASADTEPALDTGEGNTTATADDGTTTVEPLTSGPVVTTGDDATTGEGTTTGEPVDPDLVLWLALDRAPLGDVPDASSYMGNGACEGAGCPEGGRGVVGGGAWFDGTDDVITVPHAPWLETTEAYTIAAFIRIGDVPLDFRSVMAKPFGPALANSWELYFQGQLLYTGMSGAADGEYWEVTSPWAFPPDAWVHVASTWDGSLLTLWLDGDAVGSIEVPAIVFDEQAIHVGADDDHDVTGPVGYFLGGVDDVRVYRRALTAEELAALASG